MSFKIDEIDENRNSGKTRAFRGVVGLIESIILIILAVVQINQVQTNVWKITGYVILAIVSLFILDAILDAFFDFNDWIKKKLFGKKSSHDIYYENLEQVINMKELKATAQRIKQQFGQHIEMRIEDADYFGFYRGLNIEIIPYTLETGKMKPEKESVETWLCEIDENPNTGEITIKHSDIKKEIIVERPLLSSLEIDEWDFTLKPLVSKDWTPIVLQSLSLTPNYRFVKFCLKKNKYLFVYHVMDKPVEVIQDNF